MVENALVSRPGLRGLSEKLKQEIRDIFFKQADGSFRWAYLSLDNLARKNTPRQVRAALQGLPASLGDIYADILGRIPEETRELAQKALLWLIFARRPLTLAELNEAIIIEDGQTDIDEDDRICRETAVLETCHGLLDCYNGVVSLSHSSVETYLTKTNTMPIEAATFGLEVEDGDRILMRVCLQYLSMEPFASGHRRDDKELLETLKQYPLLDYAAQTWAVHAHPWDLEILSTTHPLYYAASFGLYQIVQTILQEDPHVDINAQGGRYGSRPLFVACWREHYDIAHLLLDAGADVTLEDEASGFTALSLVSQWGKDSSETRKLIAHMLTATATIGGAEQVYSLEDNGSSEHAGVDSNSAVTLEF
ncbi:hypothetical protein D6D27_06299 [Aureobasidium pullulans]|nr:hypothetical protein D6D27_06299 [Aureobasidium pullulans]